MRTVDLTAHTSGCLTGVFVSGAARFFLNGSIYVTIALFINDRTTLVGTATGQNGPILVVSEF
jgi:hypothetical protein